MSKKTFEEVIGHPDVDGMVYVKEATVAFADHVLDYVRKDAMSCAAVALSRGIQCWFDQTSDETESRTLYPDANKPIELSDRDRALIKMVMHDLRVQIEDSVNEYYEDGFFLKYRKAVARAIPKAPRLTRAELSAIGWDKDR